MRNRWLAPGAIKLHVALILALPVMLGLGWWQLQRALAGHARSWAYAVQWPAFAAYAVYLWWKLLREQPGFRRPGDPEPPAEPADDGEGPGPRHIVPPATRPVGAGPEPHEAGR